MVYTVGEMARLLGVPASTLRYMTKRVFFLSLKGLPVEFACSRSPISNGSRSLGA